MESEIICQSPAPSFPIPDLNSLKGSTKSFQGGGIGQDVPFASAHHPPTPWSEDREGARRGLWRQPSPGGRFSLAAAPSLPPRAREPVINLLSHHTRSSNIALTLLPSQPGSAPPPPPSPGEAKSGSQSPCPFPPGIQLTLASVSASTKWAGWSR